MYERKFGFARFDILRDLSILDGLVMALFLIGVVDPRTTRFLKEVTNVVILLAAQPTTLDV
jgi:hypothetical protein